MSTFTDYPVETTPYLSKPKYNDKQIYISYSIIDIAHKSGYTTHRYSNQDHLPLPIHQLL